MSWSPAAQRVLFVVAAALFAFSLYQGAVARRPVAVPVPDDPRLEILIDINRASLADLEALPGVGPALAAKIAGYRDAHGPFSRAEDLERVPGLGRKLAASLRAYVTVASREAQSDQAR